MDECGINNNEARLWGYAPVGERLFDVRPGSRAGRISIMAGLHQGKLIAPFVYQGTCTARTTETWLEQCLLPNLPPGKVIVMDNAPFHNSAKIREIIENAGCILLYLPTYSPDFNPIEHWWAKVKNAIRKALKIFNFDLNPAIEFAFKNL
jgi:transposase